MIVREPPKVGSGSYGILEIQVDADGNDLAGIRSVFLQTPIGTYTGWNLGRKDRFENGMCNLQGSFIPFASTKAERIAAGDPRLSIEERYPTKDAYLAAFKKAADDLVAKRFLVAGRCGLVGQDRRNRGRSERSLGLDFTVSRCFDADADSFGLRQPQCSES